jgi:hypothetical protein
VKGRPFDLSHFQPHRLLVNRTGTATFKLNFEDIPYKLFFWDMWSTVDNILVLIDLFWTSIEFFKIHMFTLFLNYVYLNAVPLEVLILTPF